MFISKLLALPNIDTPSSGRKKGKKNGGGDQLNLYALFILLYELPM